MQRLANGTQVSGLPTPIVESGTPGYATAGNPATSLPASEWDADQYNRMQEELTAPVLAAGLTLDPNNNGQLLEAIPIIATGRLLATQKLTGTGTYTPSSAAVKSIRVRGCGGGGAGGGTQLTTSSQVSIGGAGSGGSFGKALFTSGFTGGIAYSVGAGGTAATGSAGANGGATTLTGLANFPGGLGGGVGLGVAPPAVASAAASPATATFSGAAQVFVACSGWHGDNSMAAAISNAVGGGGGNSPYGSGGGQTPATSAGLLGNGYGAGGAAAACLASYGSNAAGGNGTPGILYIDEYS
jgi:hypothetical protein